MSRSSQKSLWRGVECAWRIGALFSLAFLLLLDGAGNSQTAHLGTQPNQTQPTREVWAESRLAGSPIGHYREAKKVAPNGDSVTTIKTLLVFNRLGSKLELSSQTSYRESADGRLLAIHSLSSSSAQSTTTDVTVHPETLAIRTTTGGKTYDRSLRFTDELLGPEAARRLLISRLRSPGDVVSYQMFFPELGAVTAITDTLTGMDSVTAGGAAHQALKLEQTMAAMPGKSFLWLDTSGWLLRQVVPSPLGEIETVLSSAQTIRDVRPEATELSDESFRGTLAIANVRLPEERLIEQVKLRITHKKPELGWPDLTTENQTVLEKTRDHVILEVRRVLPMHGSDRLLETKKKDLSPYLAPNALLQSDDADIQTIAKRVVGDERDAYAAAIKLRDWTGQNMRFDPGIAIAPASEVVRNRRGTCLGYAILLGALARAAGIPSRVRMGFVYAGGIWGGHAWVDVLAGDEWLPLDAALHSPGPTDAARFSFFTSALESGTISGTGSLAKLYGNVDIQILEYTIRGRRVDVPQNAKPYSVSGDTYRNCWLGITVRKPSTFRFTKLDAVWPEKTLLGIEGPGNRSVEIESDSASLPVPGEHFEEALFRNANLDGKPRAIELQGQPAVLVSAADHAGLVLQRGGTILFVESIGRDAAELLMDVVSKLQIDRRGAPLPVQK